MNAFEDDALIERALRAAATWHTGQTRKNSGLPYITHPMAVALLLARAGASAAVIATALLHDVVEDCDCSLNDLAVDFPPDVVHWVECLSEIKHDEAGQLRSWADRKHEHRTRLAGAPREARMIKLADVVHNLHSIWIDGASTGVWLQFKASPTEMLADKEALLRDLWQGEPELEPLAMRVRALIDDLRESVVRLEP